MKRETYAMVAAAACGILYPSGAGAAMAVNILGVTATQAILSYQAPDANACAILVKDDTGALVHDVDPSLFPGANLDLARPSSLVSGAARVVVIGKRAAEKAVDGRYYSRALQTATAHTYAVACNGASASGSLTTQNAPLGNTYNEPFPADRANPGKYAWPTLNLSDPNQRIVDSQTGVLIQPFVTHADGSPVPWAASSTNLCAAKPVTDGTGQAGSLCTIGLPADGQPAIYFVGFNGETRVVGVPHVPFLYFHHATPPLDSENYCANLFFDSNDPSTFRCVLLSDPGPGRGVFPVKGHYVGDYRAADPGWTRAEMPPCDATHATNCIQWTFLSAHTMNQLFAAQVSGFDPGRGTNLVGIQQNRYWIFDSQMEAQNSQGWVFVYDEVADALAGLTGTVSQPANGLAASNPLRWCGLHGVASVQDGWVDMAFDPLFGGPAGAPGFGPYRVNIVSGGPLTATLAACPTTVYGHGGEALCSVVTVDGDPRNPAPQTSNGGQAELLQTQPAAEGDVVAVINNEGVPGFNASEYEYMRLIQKSGPNGNTWALLRNLGNGVQWPLNHTGTSQLYMGCNTTYVNGSPGAGVEWQYLADPQGADANGQSLLREADSGSHASESPNYIVRDDPTFYTVNQGPLTLSWEGTPTATYVVNGNPAFAGVTGIGIPQSTDGHPSSVMPLASGEALIVDGHPFNFASNNPQHGNIHGTLVTGSLYRLTSNAYGAHAGAITSIVWDPQNAPVYAHCGDKVMVDVSGPGAVLSGASADAYKYCLARHAGECMAGSAVGDVYANCPNATSASCDGSAVDLCFGQNGGRLGAIIEADIAQADPAGLRSRVITQGFGLYEHPDGFWNASWLPGAAGPQALLFDVVDPNGAAGPQIYRAQLPPFPALDAVARNGPLTIPFAATPPAGVSVDNAVVQFGYAENGTTAQLSCTGRQEACVKGAQPGTAFGYASDPAIAGVPCATGCVLNIPALPQRIVYFEVLYRDASNRVVATDGLRAVASEPPYAASSSGNPPPPFVLNWPATAPLDQPLPIDVGSLPVANVEWDFAPADAAAPSRQAASAEAGVITTPVQALVPSQHQVTVGAYKVTVKLFDAQSALLAQAARGITFVAATLGEVKVYPNPWRSDKHAGKGITFDGLAMGTTIKLFTTSGHRVKELHSDGPKAAWDLTNEAGEKVASGLYLYVVTDARGDQVRGKIGVIK